MTTPTHGIRRARLPGAVLLGAAVLMGAPGCLGDAEVVSVLEPTARIDVTAASGPLLPGQTTQLTARVVGANGRELNRPVTWSSSNPSVASVNNTGLVSALAAGEVTITARHENTTGTAIVRIDDPCGLVAPFSIGTPVSGALGPFDCVAGGITRDYYSLTLANANLISFTLTSNDFEPLFVLENADQEPVAIGSPQGTPANSGARVALVPGTYRIVARPGGAGQQGAYSLTGNSTAGQPITGCQPVWLSRGIQVSERVAVTDCVVHSATGQPFYSDIYFIYLVAGRPVRLDHVSDEFDAYLELLDADYNVIVANDDGGEGTDARITFTPSQSGVFVVNVATNFSNTVGRYTITVQ